MLILVLGLAGWALAVAVLAFSLTAKAADWTTAADAWPVTGWAGYLLSPHTVTVTEAAVAFFALAPVPAVPRLAALGALFTAYTTAALILRGQPCGCFGSRLPGRFTSWHIAGCAVLAALVLAACAARPAPAALTMTATAALAAGAGLYLTPWRRPPAGQTGPRADPALIDHIVIYGRDACRFCATLWDQQDYYRSFTDLPVYFRTATDDEQPITAGRVPAAVGYDTQGALIEGPVHGLDDIRDYCAAQDPCQFPQRHRTAERPFESDDFLSRTVTAAFVLVHHAELTDEFRHLLQHCHHRVLGALTAMRAQYPPAPGDGR